MSFNELIQLALPSVVESFPCKLLLELGDAYFIEALILLLPNYLDALCVEARGLSALPKGLQVFRGPTGSQPLSRTEECCWIDVLLVGVAPFHRTMG